MVEAERNRSELEGRAPVLSGRCKSVGEVLAQRAMHDGDRPIIEISHQHHGMPQLLAEQDGVADHSISLKRALSNIQPQVAVEDVNDSTRPGFEVNAQAGPRLAAGAVTQVVLLLVQDRKRGQYPDAERSVAGRVAQNDDVSARSLARALG